MTDITEIIGDLIQCANSDGHADVERYSDATKAAHDQLLAAYREQAAELAELREYKRKCEEQEPHYFEFWAGAFDRCSKEQYESLPEGNRFKFYTHPIPSAPAVPEWLPIETAPKQKMVLLAGEFDCEGDWRIKVGYFDVASGGWKIFGASWEPTHWMPLPAAPTKENVE